MLKLLGGLISLALVVILALMLLVSLLSVQLAGTPSSGGSCLSSSARTGGCTGNGAGAALAALSMAPHLQGNPDAWYDAGMPQGVLSFWSKTCPAGSGCWIDWQEGNLQCVLFVTGAYALAGSPLPAVGNAIDFWSLYQNRAGWLEIPSAAASPSQRGLPMPGDIMVWYNPPPAVGHVAIVVGVTRPSAGHAGSVTFAEANGPGALVTETLLPDLSVETWSSYTVLGYIRPLTPIGVNASQHLVRVSQLDPGQYGSASEFTTWALSACSTAAMTEVLDAYGEHLRIHDVLAVEAARGDITPSLGLTSLAGIADTLAHFGFHTSWGFSRSLDQVIAQAQQGTPVIVDFPPDRYPDGHLLVVTGGTADTVTVADSSSHDYTVLSRSQFVQWWNGFSALVASTG